MSWQSVVLVHKDRQSEPASIPQRSKVRSASRSKLPPVTRGLGRQVVDVPRARGPSGKANDRPTASHNLCPRRRQDVPCSRELDEVGGRCSSFPSISPVELFQAPIPAGHSRPAPPGGTPPGGTTSPAVLLLPSASTSDLNRLPGPSCLLKVILSFKKEGGNVDAQTGE